jgi:hypothetical protein
MDRANPRAGCERGGAPGQGAPGAARSRRRELAVPAATDIGRRAPLTTARSRPARTTQSSGPPGCGCVTLLLAGLGTIAGHSASLELSRRNKADRNRADRNCQRAEPLVRSYLSRLNCQQAEPERPSKLHILARRQPWDKAFRFPSASLGCQKSANERSLFTKAHRHTPEQLSQTSG